MTSFGFILRNLRHFRKPYLAMLAGIMLSAAVLTGALVVGDSVRYSLEQLTDIRLGKTRFAFRAEEHYFRQDLAQELSAMAGTLVVPVLNRDGMIINPVNNKQINRVDVTGIDSRFADLWDNPTKTPAADEAVISQNVAETLGLQSGDEIVLKMPRQSNAPQNAPFVAEKESPEMIRLKVLAVADDRQTGRFSLKANQVAPYNVFISLSMMARRSGIRDCANGLLIPDYDKRNLNPQKLDSLIHLVWKMKDAGLEIRRTPNAGYEIRSERIFLGKSTSQAIAASFPGSEPVLTYLVNAMSKDKKSTPYSFVTAMDNGLQLKDNEIVINDWLANDLGVKAGDTVNLRYYRMGPFRNLTEDSTRFLVREVLPIIKPIFDRTMMPDFPGMSDAGNCRDWQTGTPVDLSSIRDKDEQYWKDFRGTPKAFISLAAGQKLWDNPFGNATEFRFQADSADLKSMKKALMQKLNPAEVGLTATSIYEEGKSAATNATDFGGLFLSLSFFIIVAALLLVALLLSLHAQSRMSETAVLSTLGFRKKDIIRGLATETALVVITGSLMGAVAGIFYNKLLLIGLNTLWQGAVGTKMLQIHLVPTTFLTGFVISGLVAFLTMIFVLRRNLKKSLSTGVKGAVPQHKRRAITAIALLAIGTFTILVTGFNHKSGKGEEENPQSGTGGFLFWGENTMPILYDLNTAAGKEKYGLKDEEELGDLHFVQMLRLDGNDASCLNLNQVRQPAILGLDAGYMDKKQAFSFGNLAEGVNAQHPWAILEKELYPGVIPAFADQTVIQWGLRKKTGDTILYMDESGKKLFVKIMGGLENSVFQGNILISDALFRKYYPSTGGSKVMLVDGKPSKKSLVSERLGYLFQDFGMMLTPTSERLAQFNAVENTYLSVFMILGGLGMLIGTIGLGIVLLRNLAERKQEIALYRAIGFRKQFIHKILIVENLRVLIKGMGIGLLAAIATLLPSYINGSLQWPGLFVVVLLMLIILNGIFWIIVPIKVMLKKELNAQLRKE